MLEDESKLKPVIDAKDEQVIDDVMDEFEHMLAKVKSGETVKQETEEKSRKKKKHHRHRSPDSKADRKKSR